MTTPHPEEPAEGAREPGETDSPDQDDDGPTASPDRPQS